MLVAGFPVTLIRSGVKVMKIFEMKVLYDKCTHNQIRSSCGNRNEFDILCKKMYILKN